MSYTSHKVTELCVCVFITLQLQLDNTSSSCCILFCISSLFSPPALPLAVVCLLFHLNPDRWQNVSEEVCLSPSVCFCVWGDGAASNRRRLNLWTSRLYIKILHLSAGGAGSELMTYTVRCKCLCFGKHWCLMFRGHLVKKHWTVLHARESCSGDALRNVCLPVGHSLGAPATQNAASEGVYLHVCVCACTLKPSKCSQLKRDPRTWLKRHTSSVAIFPSPSCLHKFLLSSPSLSWALRYPPSSGVGDSSPSCSTFLAHVCALFARETYCL